MGALVGSRGGLGREEGRNRGFGLDFYFCPRGPWGLSDRAKRSPILFWARVAGTTLPPTPARHPPPGPLFKRHGHTGMFLGPGVRSPPEGPVPSCWPATLPDAYGHTTGNTPEPVRFQKLSLVRPS